MKASAIGYGTILLILIITTLVTNYIMGGPSTTQRGIVSIESKLIVFQNFVELFTKSFDQSIEFMVQRTAYDLSKKGGMEQEMIWTEEEPTMQDLKESLESAIESILPSSTINGVMRITFGEGDVSVSGYDSEPCGPPQDSECFFADGGKVITIYDGSIDARSKLDPHYFHAMVDSNYFKLINAGRAIMEDSAFNQYLDDRNQLMNSVYAAKAAGDARFSGLDFEPMLIAEDIVQITIIDYCYPPETYCLSPLSEGESGELDIPYDYNRLIFKYQKAQKDTPVGLVYDFGLKAIPDKGTIDPGLCELGST